MQAPSICPGYQTGIYNITVYDDAYSAAIIDFGPTKYTQESEEEHALIVKEVKSGMSLGGLYIVEVSVESFNSYCLKRKTISKFIAHLVANL